MKKGSFLSRSFKFLYFQPHQMTRLIIATVKVIGYDNVLKLSHVISYLVMPKWEHEQSVYIRVIPYQS